MVLPFNLNKELVYCSMIANPIAAKGSRLFIGLSSLFFVLILFPLVPLMRIASIRLRIFTRKTNILNRAW